jgi:SMI1-KNR4 cell-wall
MKAIFEKIKELGWIDSGINNATDIQIENVESILNIKFPKTYILFVKEYLNIRLGSYEILTLNSDDNLYLIAQFEDAKKYFDLPEHLIPFLEDNGDYFCFDTTKINDGEYSVKYWSHNGTTDEKWDNFMDWVEKCWLGEYLNSM